MPFSKNEEALCRLCFRLRATSGLAERLGTGFKIQGYEANEAARLVRLGLLLHNATSSKWVDFGRKWAYNKNVYAM